MSLTIHVLNSKKIIFFYSGIKSIELSWQQPKTRLSWYSWSSVQGDGATIIWSSVNGNSKMSVKVLTKFADAYVPFVTKTKGISLLHKVFFIIKFWIKKILKNENY